MLKAKASCVCPSSGGYNMAQTYQVPAGFTEQDTIRLNKLNALIEG